MKKMIIETGETVLLEDEDYCWASQFKWWSNKANSHLSIHRKLPREGISKVRCKYLHREIMERRGIDCGNFLVDHKDRNALNNQRSNLRRCTPSQSVMNRACYGKARKYRGVRQKPCGSFSAEISANHKRYYLGTFEDEKAAAAAYNDAAKRLHGEFACINEV